MSSPPSPSSSLFASMPPRPPTPPRDVSKDVDDALRFLEEGHDEPVSKPPVAKAKTYTDTPPAKFHVSPATKDSTATKKVGFMPDPTYHDIPHLSQSSSPENRALRQTPLARTTKPLKSILKAANELVPLTPDDLDSKLSILSPSEPGSFRRMLQSVIKQLGGSSRDARQDAYLALNGTFKAYSGVPDSQALVDKIDLLRQFLTRDMAWKDASGKPDTRIVAQAIQLTCALLMDQHTAQALDDDFRCFIIDRSIAVLEQSDTSKAVAKSHLNLLAVQRFRPQIMTAARIDKILSLLQNVEDRNSLVAARLIIYTRLVEQSPSAMLNKIRDWIEHVFHGMLSSVSDVQRRAIDTCTTAGYYLGTHPQAAKAICELCEKETEEGSVYSDHINLQLIRMSADKDKAAMVPQIWAAVILMFRSKRRPVDKWPRLKDWLLTIQKCLNSSDLEVKQYANMAWNKLVYAVMPDSSVVDSMRSMLKVPIVAGLEKRGSDRVSQQMRQIAMDSYCNLLHYALRPSLSHEEIDAAWDMYVQPVLATVAKSSSKGAQNACRVLHGMLKRTSGTWNQNAANQREAIKPDDLPRLDVRWVRSRLDRIIKLIEPILLAGMWQPLESNRAADGTWRAIMRSVAEAGAQEVKTSMELKDAIAQLTNLFRRLWLAPAIPRPETDPTTWVARYHSVLQATIEALGSSHFVEDVLSKTNADEVEVAPTPTHRISKSHSSACSSFVFLFSLYYQESPSIRFDVSRRDSAIWFLDLLASAKGSTAGTLGLLTRAMQSCSDFQSERLRDVPALLWGAIADTAMDTLRTQVAVSPQRDTMMVGSALRSTLSILLEGLQYANTTEVILDKVSELYHVTCEAAKQAAGNGGVVVGVMEPLSKSVLDRSASLTPHVLMCLSTVIATNGTWPKDRAEMETSRKALWTINLEPSKAQAFDPFDSAYSFSNAAFERSYSQFQSGDTKLIHSTMRALSALVDLLRICPSSILFIALRRYQAGLVPWIQDSRRLIFPLVHDAASGPPSSLEHDEISRLRSRLNELWTAVLRLIETCCTGADSLVLGALEPLLIAALSSPSKDIVNKTIVFWNSTFGEQSKLDYPMRLLPVLHARQAQTEIILPGYPKTNSGEELANLPAFAESQSGLVDRRRGFAGPRSTPEIRKKLPMENIFIKQHLAAQGLPYNAVTVAANSSNGSTPQSRLRHNDSQVDFEPIEAAPSPDLVEPQLLTERQKEVKARQRDDAQMFPEFLSSPIRQSAAPRSISKLNFTANVSNTEPETNVTPTGPSGGIPMSDDLPSSPTPRATGTAKPTDELVDDSDQDDTTEVDPPSSPPRTEEEQVDQSDQVDGHAEILETVYETALEDADSRVTLDDPQYATTASDLPSDTPLPSAQLRREAEAAAAEVAPAEEPVVTQQSLQTPSRIENSVVELEDELDETASIADTVQSDAPKVTRKRRRKQDTIYVPRKQKKPQSPWNSFKSKIFGYSQDEDDDIEDEIIVATRTVSSPASSAREGDGSSQARAQCQDTSQEQPSDEPAQLIEKPVKRKRGRPRKSESQQCVKDTPAPSRGLKRSASALSVASIDSQVVSSIVENSSSPPNGKRGRKPGRKSQQSQESEQSVEEHVQDEESEMVLDQRDGDDQGVVTSGRKIAQPSSILGNLREILANCKNMIVGSKEEERQFDDVLFELRQEVFEAGKRGQERK